MIAALLIFAIGVIVAPVYWLAARALWGWHQERRRLEPWAEYMNTRGKHDLHA